MPLVRHRRESRTMLASSFAASLDCRERPAYSASLVARLTDGRAQMPAGAESDPRADIGERPDE